MFTDSFFENIVCIVRVYIISLTLKLNHKTTQKLLSFDYLFQERMHKFCFEMALISGLPTQPSLYLESLAKQFTADVKAVNFDNIILTREN